MVSLLLEPLNIHDSVKKTNYIETLNNYYTIELGISSYINISEKEFKSIRGLNGDMYEKLFANINLNNLFPTVSKIDKIQEVSRKFEFI